jgi:hypothetical protein
LQKNYFLVKNGGEALKIGQNQPLRGRMGKREPAAQKGVFRVEVPIKLRFCRKNFEFFRNFS